MSVSILNYWRKAFNKAFGKTHWFRLRAFMGTVGVAILAGLFGGFVVGSLAGALIAAFSLLLCYLVVALVSLFANLVRAPALFEYELETKQDGEISNLREQIVALSKKPCDDALEKEVADLLAKLPPEAEKVLKFLLSRGELEDHEIGEALKDEVENVYELLKNSVSVGLLKLRASDPISGIKHFPFPMPRRHYSIPESFIPVLRVLLHRNTFD